MSKKQVTLNFDGGMNNAMPPHLLKENEAELIRNLYKDKDGVWKDINEPKIMLDLSETHLANAVKVVQWKPSKVPSDCIDDFVYVVFCSDGIAKLVYRGTEGLVLVSIDIKARIFGTTNYRSVAITNVTEDVNGNSDGITSTSPSAALTRQYWSGTSISMTAAEDANEGEEFLHWIDADSGAVLDDDRVLALTLSASRAVIAEYVGVPYIRVEDEDGVEIVTLGSFSAMEGEYSEEKSYYAGGVSLTNPLRIYPPTDFEIQKEGDAGWTAYGDYVEISAATANATMTKINVRYAPQAV